MAWTRTAFLSVAISCGALTGALGTITGCCIDPVNGDRYFCLGDMTDAEEARLGQSHAPDFIAQSGGIYRDPELESYLRAIVIDDLARRSQRPGLPWEFHILNTSQVNAFALPGGQVFVTRGLLAVLESEAQFAHLMGHEIGHVAHKHSSRGQGRQAIFGVLVGVVSEVEGRITDGNGLAIASTALGFAGQLTLLRFSRHQELESDERGVDYALLAGYDPREGRRTFETFLRLKESSGQGESAIQNLLSTHPLDSTRIQALDEYIEHEVPGVQSMNLMVEGPEWNGLIHRLKSAQKAYDQHDEAIALLVKYDEGDTRGPALLDDASKKLRAAVAQLPGQAPFPLGLALVEIARERPDAALTELDRAIALDGEFYAARFTRGQVRLGRNDAVGAREDLLVAARLFPLSPHPRLLLGFAAEKLGEQEEALRRFRETIERSERGTEPYRRAEERLRALGTGPA